MKEQVLKILQELKPGVDFTSSTSLVDDGLLDSLDVMNLSVELNDEFDIEITPLDVVPENFNSVEAITALVERLADE
ncbi:acyl carrier protein [Eggerthia catenaformis OT 569 = DSM 20559]|uniref:Acyl carrier protein n=1 Tax=Eggerthia catenaformis OT 569 = DSM 20559 TaxID=999415 RepID=M2NGN4_9FIRM|nr:acyl carrier protein [Eggerthia catenaformis]EMD17388.1 acyl carrier protein [Eggerthia catenaformis OT 569 = DSM 20559]